ncbi:MAG: BON domain-containing protein [bacterium]
MKKDLELQRDVSAELARDPFVRDENVGIAVHEGVVTLTGTVDDYAQRRVAETVVARVPGVRAVVQDISVHLPIEADLPDPEIARRSVEALERSRAVPHEDIQLLVENGWVTLEGMVGCAIERRAAELAIAPVAGIHGIRNLLGLRPHPTAHELELRIKEGLARFPSVSVSRQH